MIRVEKLAFLMMFTGAAVFALPSFADADSRDGRGLSGSATSTADGARAEVSVGSGGSARRETGSRARPSGPSPYFGCLGGAVGELADTSVVARTVMAPWAAARAALSARTSDAQRAGSTGYRSCLRLDGAAAQAWLVGGGSPVDVVPGLTASAEQALVVPVPEVSTSPPQESVLPVGLPVWFWVDNGEALTESAAVPGVSVTVQAVVASTAVEIDGPEGAVRLACEGAGRRFDPEVHGAWERSDCSHVFDRTGPVEVTVAVTWDLSWSSTTGGSGVLDQVTRATTVTLEPVELEAVVD